MLVADLDRQHRVLQLRKPLLRLFDGVPGRLDQRDRAVRARGAGLCVPVAIRQPMAGDELATRAPGPGIRRLNRTEQLLLEPVAKVLVDLLVRIAEIVERKRDLIGRLTDLADDPLAGFKGGVRHDDQITRHPEVPRKDLVDVPLIFPAFLISSQQIDHLLGRWGYVVVFAVVLAQASGVPVPGTTALAAAAVYAATTHRLAIAGVIIAAAAGAILGFAISFAVGRAGGWRLLDRYGARLRLTEMRLRSARAFFASRGGTVVVLSRFVTGLRTWGGLIAGANLMPWPRFLVMNVIGGLAWAIGNGIGYYLFGDAINSASTAVQIALIALGVVSFLATVLVLRNRARSFVRSAEPERSHAAD